MDGNDPLGVRKSKPWMCPIKAHEDRALLQHLPFVEVRDGVSYCTYSGCKRSSVDGFSRR